MFSLVETAKTSSKRTSDEEFTSLGRELFVLFFRHGYLAVPDRWLHGKLSTKIRKRQAELQKLEKRMRREPQVDVQMDMHKKVRQMRMQLAELKEQLKDLSVRKLNYMLLIYSDAVSRGNLLYSAKSFILFVIMTSQSPARAH